MKREATIVAVGAAITATLSLTLAPAPAFAQAAASKIDPADTAWMMAASALVLMMTIPGLALFYCGMVRKKNVLATMAHVAGLFFDADHGAHAVLLQQRLEIGDGAHQAVLERRARRPSQHVACLGDVGLVVRQKDADLLESIGRHGL